ncbi:hypothetical protein HJC23_001045 [Cyclotella cryptica]|uniref:Uncharacterized protein n=1 Tax=Cyclotella cryptica TaxID=29204 RepID=A0ABD3QI93_9STRA
MVTGAMTVITRVSHIASGIGPKIPHSIITDLAKKKASHVSFHSNKITDLQVTEHADKGGQNISPRVSSLEHVVELDLSSNNLHEGCELSQFICHTTHSLLGVTNHLVKLNLASNGLTEKSLVALMSTEKSNHRSPLLPCLRDLDVSRNNISGLPTNLNELCPILIHFNCMNNRLKSLTSLLQVLHHLRGRLQSIYLLDRSIGSDRNNPVCTKRMYREKVVFILGSTLIKLDGVKITREEREAVRRQLARNYVIDNEATEAHLRCNQHRGPNYFDNSSHIASKSDHVELVPKCYEKDQQITNLELQVASLCAIVDKQTRVTNDLLKAAQDNVVYTDIRNEGSTISKIAGHNEHDVEQESTTVRSHGIVVRYKMSATSAVLRGLFVDRRRKHTNLLLAFSRWRLFIGFFHYSKRVLSESQDKWQKRTDDMINSAVSSEVNRSQEKLSLSEAAARTANERVTELTAAIQDFELERKKHRDEQKNSIDIIDQLQKNIRQMNIAAIDRNDDQTRLIGRLEADLQATTKELRDTNEKLDTEKSKLDHLLQSHKQSCEEAKDAAAIYSADLEALRMENIKKDATIRQLKIAFEEVAVKAATDRSKAERSSLAERQSKEVLRRHNQRMSDLESEAERLASAKEHLENVAARQNARFAELQKQVHLKTSNVADMSCEIDKLNRAVNEKNDLIAGLERKLNVSTDTLRETQKYLKECRKGKSRLKQRCDHLQSQLGQAHDEMRAAKVCTVQKNLLDVEKSKNAELQRTLEKLRQESNERDLELRAAAQRMHRENEMIRENSRSGEQLANSLERKLKRVQGEWKSREDALVSSHKLELKEIKISLEQENVTLKNALESERMRRLEAERRIATLEASQNEHKSKMQSAIEGLAKQFTMP